MKKVLMLANHEVVLYNFRKELIYKLLENGYEVYISLPYGKRVDDLVAAGCKYVAISISRRGINPFVDLRTFLSYRKILHQIKPNIVLTYTIKPNIYGGFACRLCKVPYLCNITGLGTALEQKYIFKKFTFLLYKISLRNAEVVFFQNQENLNTFVKEKIIFNNYKLLPGSGVNLIEYTPLPFDNNENTINFTFMSRIFPEKGIDLFLDAAKIIKTEYLNIRFLVIGFCEEEYDRSRLDEYNREGIIEYYGMQEDIRPILTETHCIIHPTYYYEGLSNVLLEGAACARPLITTDCAGCREAIDEGVNGYLTQPRDVNDLVEKIRKFLTLSNEEKRNMGLAGRRKVEQEFDRCLVVDTYIKEIEKTIYPTLCRDKKVLFVTSVASMVDQFCMPSIRLLQSMGYSVDVACNFKNGNTSSPERVEAFKNELELGDIRYYQIDFSRHILRINKIIASYKQLDAVFQANNYLFAHCHSPIGGFIGRLATKKYKVKSIYTAHGFHFYKGAPILNWFTYYLVERIMARYTDVLVTINKEDYEIAKKFKAKETKYIPGVGINVDALYRIKIDVETKRAELEIPKSAVVIISVGELNKNKNHETIIKAISKLKYHNIFYLICGLGEYSDYLINLARTHNIENQVYLLGFRVDVLELYKTADIFAFPSKREGLSVALMEAMACGLPVVCSKIRGNIELIEEGAGGFLCEPNDYVKFAQNISKLVEDANLRKQMGEHNVKAIEPFKEDSVMEEMRKIYTYVGDIM